MHLVPMVSVPLDRFGSHGVTVHHPTGMTRDDLFVMDGPSSVVVGELVAGAVIGRHPATDAQLLTVVSGSIIVTTDEQELELTAGQAVLFVGGEQHQTRALTSASLVMFEQRGRQRAPGNGGS